MRCRIASSLQEKLDDSQIAVLWTASAAMAADVAGAYTLTDVQDLMFEQQMNVDLVTQCVAKHYR